MTVGFAIAMGWLAGAWHLGITAARARSVGSGQAATAMALLPLGILGPVGAVFATIQLDPGSVWAVLPGLIGAQVMLVGPLGRRVGAP